MLRHGVDKMGLPGNERQLVSVDISRGKRYVKLCFNDETERMRRVIKGQLDEDKLIERETTALYEGRNPMSKYRPSEEVSGRGQASQRY